LENKTEALKANQQIYLCLQIRTLKKGTPTQKYFASYQAEREWKEIFITFPSSCIGSWQDSLHR